MSTKEPIPKTRDRECKPVNQVRRRLRENERFANGERNLLSSRARKGLAQGRAENEKAGKSFALLVLRTEAGGHARNGLASTTGGKGFGQK